MSWLWLSAATMAAVAIVHSIRGERRLIGPLIAARAGVLAEDLPRRVLRLTWHLTSVLMLLCAAVVAWPGTTSALIAVVGAGWLACGLINLAVTRARHIGGPFLSAAGVFALLGSLK